MAKYGTKKYWNEELHREEIKFELMCRGFADVWNKTQLMAIEDVQEMIEELNACSNMISFNKSQRDNATDEGDDEE